MSDFIETLSPAGERRREEILRAALTEARTRRIQRRVRHGAVLCVILGVGAWITMHSMRSVQPGAPFSNQIATTFPMATHPTFVVEQIPTDPKIVERLSVTPKPAWTVIGDDDLLNTLAAVGEPAGLITADGQTVLMLHAPPEQAMEQ